MLGFVKVFLVLILSLPNPTCEKIEENKSTTVPPIETVKDDKYGEILSPVVHVFIPSSKNKGSGVIFHKYPSLKNKDSNAYLVITNHHVVSSRKSKTLKRIDGLTGHPIYEVVDQGCRITFFWHTKNEHETYHGNVITESKENDLALVYFESDKKIENLAMIPSQKMLDQIRVFDEVYAVGCQLGGPPIPTKGIVSRIFNSENYVGFMTDAPISPGSSGGGVFKKFGSHYYLIGVSQQVGVKNWQFIPHLAYSISTKIIKEFLISNGISHGPNGIKFHDH
jgi:S1-C subfamily serine protease